MRRDEPDRHGRAADALIATYVRELLVDDEPEVAPDPARATDVVPMALTASAARTAGPDAATL